MPFLFILLVAEALGFGLLIAPFVAAAITPNSAIIVGFIIAFVMAIIAAGLTHAAGQEIYETGLIRKMRRVAADLKSPLYKRAIGNDDDQSVDEKEADVTRFGNRVLESVEDRGSAKFIIIASIFVIIVLGASTVLRFENLRLAVTQQSAMAADGTTANGNPFATPGALPPQAVQNGDAAANLQSQENFEQLLGGTAGIIGLGMIFVFTQVYCTSLGIQWGHIKRRRVETAYRNGTQGYASYEDYRRHQLAPRIRRTERRLQQLRGGLFSDSHLAAPTFSFRSWMDRKLELEAGQAARLPAPSRPLLFDAQREAREVMEIADSELRRERLRLLVTGLSAAEIAALQSAIRELKRQAEENAWINEV